MEDIKIEMSTVDEFLPKYYKGYDMDILCQRLLDRKPLTKEENNIIREAIDIYHEKHFEESKIKVEEWKKAHPGEYTKQIHFQRTDKGRLSKI